MLERLGGKEWRVKEEREARVSGFGHKMEQDDDEARSVRGGLRRKKWGWGREKGTRSWGGGVKGVEGIGLQEKPCGALNTGMGILISTEVTRGDGLSAA